MEVLADDPEIADLSLKAKLHLAFKRLDLDNTGTLDIDELLDLIADLDPRKVSLH